MRTVFVVFPSLPGVFCCMRGFSLVELTGHDNNAADIMVRMYIYTAAFMVINMYRYCCFHTYIMHIQNRYSMYVCMYVWSSHRAEYESTA